MRVGVAGTIAAGKSAFCEFLERREGFVVQVEELEGNPYIADFYDRPRELAFPAQIEFLAERYKNHAARMRDPTRPSNVVYDRTVWEDAVFAKLQVREGNMSPENYGTYRKIFDVLAEFAPKLDFVVLLDVSPAKAMERIEQRGRAWEKAKIGLEYLEHLGAEYAKFAERISAQMPVYRVDRENAEDENGGRKAAWDGIVAHFQQREPRRGIYGLDPHRGRWVAEPV